MGKTLHKIAAHCAPPAPGQFRALVPGVLCGWGCIALLALGHPWLCITEILRNNTNVWRLDRGLGLFSHVFYLAAMALAFFCQSGRKMLRHWPVLLPVACNIASVIVAASTNEIRYLLPTFLLAVPTALFVALSAGGENHQTKGVCEPCR